MNTVIRITAFFFILICFSLKVDGQQAGKYRVTFTDKNNSPYSVSNPQAFLSQRAIDRRTAHGIPITLEDIPVNQTYINGLLNTGVTVLNRSKWFNSAIVTISSTPQHTLISALPYVSSLEYVAPLPIKTTSDGPSKLDLIDYTPRSSATYPNYDQIKRGTRSSISVIDYGLATNQNEMISVDVLHDMGFQGQGMIIAVLDAGFTNANILPVFDSLWLNGRILGAVDFAEPGTNVFSAHSHGTMVLSIMGGNIPGQMVGTAPKASYWLLRSEIGDSEYIVEEDNWVAAAEFADSAGVDVINSSLGYTEYWDSTQNHTYEDMDGNTTRVTIGADIAAAKGIIVVASAGNSGSSPWEYIGAPSDGDSVLSIGAVDMFGTYVQFSSRGPAYGGRIKPDVAAQGAGTTIADIWGNVTSGSGTSFSSPVIAGATACLWQAVPGMGNMNLVDAIKRSSNQYMNPDSLMGYGIPDYATAALLLGGGVQPPQENRVNVYPNPFTKDIFVELPANLSGEILLTLYDMAGRKVMEQQSIVQKGDHNVLSLDSLDGLKEGLYWLRINTKLSTYSQKLIKINKP